MSKTDNEYDAVLGDLKPCDTEQGFNSIKVATVWEKKCPRCGNPYLREVFVSGVNGRSRSRIQCPKCFSRTLNVPTFIEFTDAYRQFNRGWFWAVDNEGYPVFGNGQRVNPSYL